MSSVLTFLNQQGVIKQWKSIGFMNENHYTIGTLMYYAKQDNKKAYRLIRSESRCLGKVIRDRGTTYDIASLLYKEYRHYTTNID